MKHHVMFDIDGTLIESYDFDSVCFADAVEEVTGFQIDTNWARYQHVTDTGILSQFFSELNINNTDMTHLRIKRAFLAKIKAQIAKKPIIEIAGASSFLKSLRDIENVVISIATGGWYESAILKLKSAGIDVSNISMASANDHHSRIEIMKIAEKRAVNDNLGSFTYFGDGSWDLQACKELGVNFILVGDKVKHAPSIENFEQQHHIFNYLGLQ